MKFGYFTLLVGVLITIIAEYYSIMGLTAIFSAAFWPIVIMGASLGIGKVTAAVWLKMYWDKATISYKLYLIPAVVLLMFLTGIGCFGFLSKAHSDQGLLTGDSYAKIAIYDEKIKIAKDNILANRKALRQLDDVVDQTVGRSIDEKGVDKAVLLRKTQTKERARLLVEIESEQKKVEKLTEEKAPLAAEFRKIENDVGPLKYIAALIYGDNPNSEILEKAVRLVIIVIVAVFDPLAIVLILAAQQSLKWEREKRAIKPEEEPAPAYEPDDGPLTDEQVEQIRETAKEDLPQGNVRTKTSLFDEHPYLKTPFVHFQNVKPMVAPSLPVVEEEMAEEEMDRLEDELTMSIPLTPDEQEREDKSALSLWKSQNPDDTLKHQRQLVKQGLIEQPPWEEESFKEQIHAATSLEADGDPSAATVRGFGAQFPPDAAKGNMWLRVDRMPPVLYKFNGTQWMEVSKTLNDSYVYDESYINYLIEKLGSGEYDPDQLSPAEREQIASRLKNDET